MVRIRATHSRALTNRSPISNARQRDVHLRSVSLAQESPHDYVGNRRLRNQRIFQVEIEIAGNSAAQLRVTIFPALQPDSTTPVEVQKPCFSNCGYRMRRRFLQMY